MASYGYGRVSTTAQDLEVQRQALLAAGIDPKRIYEEKRSGASMDRPELIKLLKRVKEGDEIVVYKLDRLGRTLSGILATIEDLSQRKVVFRSLNDPINTSTAMGRAFYQMAGVFAELEKSLIVERTTAGRTLAQSKGVRFGRKRLLDATKLAMARQLLQDNTLASVAATLNVSPKTLRRRLDEAEAA